MAIVGKASEARALLPPLNSLGAPSEGQHSGVRDKGDRRLEPRYRCNERAEVRILSGETPPLPAMVLDISRSGLRLEIAVALSNGQAVQIMLQREVIVFGRVRYNRRAGEAFHIGVRIDDVFYASRADDAAHLHDDDMARYLEKKGLSAAELLSTRDHLQRCRLCAARHEDALRRRRNTTEAAERT